MPKQTLEKTSLEKVVLTLSKINDEENDGKLKLSFEYPRCFGFQISAYEKAKSKGVTRSCT